MKLNPDSSKNVHTRTDPNSTWRRYRLIDCAAGYGNQAEVGQALKEIFDEGTVKREDLFIVSKLFQTHHGERFVRHLCVRLPVTRKVSGC